MNIILLFLTINLSLDTGPIDCNKCSVEILAKTEARLNNLSHQEMQMFFCTMDESCKSNIEFSEFSNELLFKVFASQAALSMKILSVTEENARKAILEELTVGNESVDLKETYTKISNTRGHNKIKKQVLKSLQSAIDKYQTK